MLSTATSDVEGCLQEIQALDAAGCEMIRLTVPSKKDLSAMPEIRRRMREEGISRPLIADVHFAPQLAVDACEFFEKVRINPGNYAGRPKGSLVKDSKPGDFRAGYERLREAITPLVHNLKRYRRALRIGVNQGSLSQRMVERYGDSPLGMVHSALEMIEMVEEQGLDQLVVSLKSSNPIIVQKAYRLLLNKQSPENRVATHLGVTEAGNELMGRMKSLVGIGVLLADGIGDTIRVSLTEPGPNEIAFARELVTAVSLMERSGETVCRHWSRPLDHQKAASAATYLASVTLGGGSSLKIGKHARSVLPTCEFPFKPDFTYQKQFSQIYISDQKQPLDVVSLNTEGSLTSISDDVAPGILLRSEKPLFDLRRLHQIRESGENRGSPVGLLLPESKNETGLLEEIELAGILSEGLVDFLLLPENPDSTILTRLLALLQATRVRMITTDYIICPSCGRTLFDIQQTAEAVKRHTRHLKGLKIGVMGCIVNGPGEMADADFGYVGSGKGKVDLYYGQSRVRRNIPETEAVATLIELIKEKGQWQDPADET